MDKKRDIIWNSLFNGIFSEISILNISTISITKTHFYLINFFKPKLQSYDCFQPTSEDIFEKGFNFLCPSSSLFMGALYPFSWIEPKEALKMGVMKAFKKEKIRLRKKKKPKLRVCRSGSRNTMWRSATSWPWCCHRIKKKKSTQKWLKDCRMSEFLLCVKK